MAEQKAANQKAAAERKAAADKKATADKKAAAEQKAALEKKATADKKTETVQKGQELMSISVHLNTGIVAGIFAVGFIVSAVLFAAITLITKAVA
ncbi:MAG: hypothetical protein QF750_00470 [Prochlorococcaceae cyanobacterium ETNP14_MAG_5]|nr:hypothetical protein [Prochlorococcaceae cyanobacterium ETNP14_MAG_5]